VADVEFQAGPARIDRLDRRRKQSVTAELNGVEMGEANKAIQALPVMRNLPRGVEQSATGQLEARSRCLLHGLAVFAGVSMIYACWSCCSARSSSRS